LPGQAITDLVLDDELQRADPARFARLLDEFAEGYRSNFRGDEAESTADWPARIAGQPAPQPLMRIAVAVDGSGRVVGGAAAEYYRASGCMLGTYLYVRDEPGQRGRGHGRRLLAKAQQACGRTGPLAAVLAEVEWPDLLPRERFTAAEIEGARGRLRFFERLDAQRIAIDYVQPALGADRQPVPWLRLLLLPLAATRPAAPDESSLRAAVDGFLAEFHAALAQSCRRPVDAALLAQQRTQLAAARPLCVALR
jgi:GNAT superfamily N-acetyltransferase